MRIPKYKTPLQFLKDNGIVGSDYLSDLSHMQWNEYKGLTCNLIECIF